MGVPVTGPITVYPEGVYPTSTALQTLGGWRVYPNTSARNGDVAAFPRRQEQGEVAYTIADGKVWVLTATPPWAGNDGDWSLWGSLSGATITLSGDAAGSGTTAIPTIVSSFNGGTPFGSMAGQNASAVAITGGTITGLGTPSIGTDATNKNYVDAVAAGLIQHTRVMAKSVENLAATYANGLSGVGATLTNSGAQSALVLDDYSVSPGDRVLIANQDHTNQNGIYIVTNIGSDSTNWVLTRATDFDQASGSEVSGGAYVIVASGAVNAATMWVETGLGPFVIGTTPILFTRLNVVTVEGLSPIANHTLLANISGSSAAPISTTVSDLIDDAIGSAQGSLLYRSASGWTVLVPGTPGQQLGCGGPAANPYWGDPGITLEKDGVTVATEPAFNLIEGTGVTLTVVDDPGSRSIDVTIAATGGAGATSPIATMRFGLWSPLGVAVQVTQITPMVASGSFNGWRLGALTGPVGADAIFDVLKSSDSGATWTSLWVSNPANRPTIADGAKAGSGTSFDTLTYAAGDWLIGSIAQIGSTTPGANVTLEIY